MQKPAYVAAAVLLLVALVGAVLLGYRLQQQNARLAAELTALRNEKGERTEVLGAEPDAGRGSRPEGDPSSGALPAQAAGPADDRAARALEAELARTRFEYGAVVDRARALEEQLKAASLQVEGLRAELEADRTAGREMAGKLEAAERNLSRMAGELQNVRGQRAQDASTMAEQEAAMKQMAERLRAQAETLDRQRGLLAADRDIRDLMSARNLHIVDVIDNDRSQALGRVFYTEGRSLIFYAFDLTDRKVVRASYAYQAWGTRNADDSTAKSLGILYLDDKSKNRWLLKFDDSDVLAQIDSVFVTIEPPGGSAKPSGRKLLYAYLKNKPNHP